MRVAHLVCGCDHTTRSKSARRQPTDQAIEAAPDEIVAIKAQLGGIETTLGIIFGDAYSHEPSSLKARRAAGDLIDRHFDGIVDQWVQAVEQIVHKGISDDALRKRADAEAEHHAAEIRADFSNALIRFIDHLREPDDLLTYIYLRRHCQQGMLSRLNPSQFNTVHIALKVVILNHVRTTMTGRPMELVRDAVVAAIDERRLMVAQFYIESRQAALQASEEKYRSSIDHAPDPMYEIEPGTWKVIGANSAAIDLHVTYDAEQLPADAPASAKLSPVNLPLTHLVPPEMRPLTLGHLEQVMRDGVAEGFDLPLGERYFDVNSALIPYGNRQFIQMILHDVTQRRAMLDELLKTERLAATGTFAAGVAHEVNNPLASISSLVQSLLSGEADPGRRMSLHTILSQITRISHTLKDLVNFARPATAHRKPINLNDIVTDTLRLVSYNKRFRTIALEPVLAPDLKPAFADDNEIQQVLLNLLFNAADAIAQEAGSIRIVTANIPGPSGNARDGKVVMKVIDNGIGIPAEHLARVLEPFFTTKPAGAGVGLGLSLCQRIVVANQGAIKLESEVGKGTTVTVALPAHHVELYGQAVSVQ